tara:strand:+ start:132 stop:440 length:309 start_codon:yes stop_codon:yes gene_type:complete
MKTEKKKEAILKVNGKNNNPRWKKLKCSCSKTEGDVLHQHPIKNCQYCYCEIADSSIPTKPWIVNEPIIDKKGNVTGSKQREVTEITLKNCTTFENVIGWSF